MIRSSLAPTAAYALVAATPGNGVILQSRTADGLSQKCIALLQDAARSTSSPPVAPHAPRVEATKCWAWPLGSSLPLHVGSAERCGYRGSIRLRDRDWYGRGLLIFAGIMVTGSCGGGALRMGGMEVSGADLPEESSAVSARWSVLRAGYSVIAAVTGIGRSIALAGDPVCWSTVCRHYCMVEAPPSSARALAGMVRLQTRG